MVTANLNSQGLTDGHSWPKQSEEIFTDGHNHPKQSGFNWCSQPTKIVSV